MYRGLKVAAVVAAAGKGSRMGSPVNKQYLVLRDKPVLAHTLEVFQRCDAVDTVVVAAARDETGYCREEIINRFSFSKVSRVLAGGETRQQSVAKGLDAVNGDIVVIHDGARPLFSCGLIVDGIRLLLEGGCQGTACAVPLKDTIKRVDEGEMAEKTLDRERLRAVQTPQCFFYPVLREVYHRAAGEKVEATDDTALLEYYGYKVRLFPGSYDNIKITTPEDLIIARALMKGEIQA